MTATGILIAAAAAVATSFAVVLQASESRQTPLSESSRFALLRDLMRRPRWLAGTGLMVVAWPLQILALTFAPITVVQPTLAAGSLVLLVIARVRLQERAGPLETVGAMALVIGIGLVIWAAPRHTTHEPETLRVAIPLAVVGAAALGTYVLGRVRPGPQLVLILSAGLAYAWVDFANKLLSNDLSTGHWALAMAWLAATIAFGAVAFLEENSALQRRPAITVSPVIGAVQNPLPVLMALWAGVESWGSASQHLATLAAGLAIVTVGAAVLGRSQAVARVSGGVTPVRDDRTSAGPWGPEGGAAPGPH